VNWAEGRNPIPWQFPHCWLVGCYVRRSVYNAFDRICHPFTFLIERRVVPRASARFAVVCCQVLAAMTVTFSAAEQTRNVSRICSSVTVIRIVVTAPTKHSAVNYSFPNALHYYAVLPMTALSVAPRPRPSVRSSVSPCLRFS